MIENIIKLTESYMYTGYLFCQKIGTKSFSYFVCNRISTQ